MSSANPAVREKRRNERVAARLALEKKIKVPGQKERVSLAGERWESKGKQWREEEFDILIQWMKDKNLSWEQLVSITEEKR